MRRWLKPLGWVATVGMFLVVVMGATVTNTGSAEGCGRSWPLCHGQLIPEFAITTLIEFSHRAVTGIEGLLLVAFAVGTMLSYWRRMEIRVLGPLMIGSLLLQAGMGAWAVLYPQTPGVIALHFGISSVAFAAVLLAATFVSSADVGESPRQLPVSAAYRRVIWASLVYVLIVVYLGAYVRHADYTLACGGWPLCNGSLFPGSSGPAGIAFLHRVAALGSVILLAGVFAWSRRLHPARPDLRRGSAIAFGLVLLQSFSGALVVATRLSLFSALSHAGLMALLFGAISYLCLQSLPARRTETSDAGERRDRATLAARSSSPIRG